MTEFCSLTLKGAIEVAKKDGAQPVLDAFAKRAASLNPKINAFLRAQAAILLEHAGEHDVIADTMKVNNERARHG